MRCLFCFSDGARIKFDKKGRPYFSCSLCSHRIFFYNPVALKSVLCWSEVAKGLTQEEYLNLVSRIEGHSIFRREETKRWISEKVSDTIEV